MNQNQKVISITEARRLFPEFKPQWQVGHPGCNEPESVALGNPKFGTVRHVVVVETDVKGEPVKALYDKMQVEEGAVGQTFPGTIIIPWNKLGGVTYVVLARKIRPVRGTQTLEFPQGYAEPGENREYTGVRELMEEIGLTPLPGSDSVAVLNDVCPEPDWFPRGTAVVAVKVDFKKLPKGAVMFSLGNLGFTRLIDSATSLAALMRFIVRM